MAAQPLDIPARHVGPGEDGPWVLGALLQHGLRPGSETLTRSVCRVFTLGPVEPGVVRRIQLK